MDRKIEKERVKKIKCNLTFDEKLSGWTKIITVKNFDKNDSVFLGKIHRSKKNLETLLYITTSRQILYRFTTKGQLKLQGNPFLLPKNNQKIL